MTSMDLDIKVRGNSPQHGNWGKVSRNTAESISRRTTAWIVRIAGKR
jgi:hypothetical protein